MEKHLPGADCKAKATERTAYPAKKLTNANEVFSL
jgi:hypothetical protein